MTATLALVIYFVSTSMGGAAVALPQTAKVATAGIGPGPAKAAFRRGSDSFAVRIRPNRAAAWNSITLAVTRLGAPLVGADITISFTMPAMAMGTQTFRLTESRPGIYCYLGPALVMPGRWNLKFTIATREKHPFTSLIVDHVAR